MNGKSDLKMEPLMDHYAWILTCPDGKEGIMAPVINGKQMPMTGKNRHMALLLEDLAKEQLRELPGGYKARLLHFYGFDEIQTKELAVLDGHG